MTNARPVVSACFRRFRSGIVFAAVLILSFGLAACANPLQDSNPSGPVLELSGASRAIQPVGTPNGKKVLFDNSHGETAGAADWVIDGGFSDFANALAQKGYYVDELRKFAPLTIEDLTGWDVLVLPECNIPFKPAEQAALLQYVQNGGSIFFIADHYNADRNKNRWDASEVFNGYRRGAFGNPTKGMGSEEAACPLMQGVTSTDWLGSNFGVRFRYNALGDITANGVVAPDQAFNITRNVGAIAMHAGSTIAVLDPTKAKGIVYLPATSAKWANAVDQGVYNGGGLAEGPFAAVAKIGAGKAAFIGDSSPVEDATPKYKREENGLSKKTYDGFKEQNDGIFLTQVVDWLSVQESYTSLTQVPGLTLDNPTPLIAIETPASSTEPQAEPWAAPAAGYKWWDRSTFAAGSYGYGVQEVSVSVSPASASLQPGASIQLSATVSGSSNGAVTWTCSGGSVSASGLFTAPASAATCVVTATSQADRTKSATATITVGSGPGAVFLEKFETGVKASYATGNVNFASGTWTLADALIGLAATDQVNGTQGIRLRNSGKLTMKFNLTTGAKTVTIRHALFGSDTGAKWGLWYSTNNGGSWIQVGGIVSAGATPATASFTVNKTGAIRFELRKTDGSSKRLNIDDFQVNGY